MMTAADLDKLLGELRPRLHRYCARMTGSAIDGEDVVQDAMIKAVQALPAAGLVIEHPEAWLFRIAHNAALDLLRRRTRGAAMQGDDELEDVSAPAEDPEVTAISLRTFLRLPPLQRSAVILKDVLGHSIDELAAITQTTVPAIKSALQRGRARLRELAAEPEDVPLPVLSDDVRARLAAYVHGFKVGDFDAVRAMLAEDVRLDLVGKLAARGKAKVGEYYGAYAAATRWAYAAGAVDGRPAMLVFDRTVDLTTPAYVVVLDFAADRVTCVRDFLFARYAMEGIAIVALPA